MSLYDIVVAHVMVAVLVWSIDVVFEQELVRPLVRAMLWPIWIWIWLFKFIRVAARIFRDDIK